MAVFQYYLDKAGKWRWRLRANNNEIIAASEQGFVNKNDCVNSIGLIKNYVQDAEIRIFNDEKEYTIYTPGEAKPVEETIVESPQRWRRWLWWLLAAILFIVLLLVLCNLGGEKETVDLEKNTTVVESIEQEPGLTSSEPVAETETVETVQPVTETKAVETVEPAAEKEVVKEEPVQTVSGTSGTTKNITVAAGDNLWNIAQDEYKSSFLWPIIYLDNQDKITDPDKLIPGLDLTVEPLAGIYPNLTSDDEAKLSQGYQAAYKVYQQLGKEDADSYKNVAEKYSR